MNHKISVIIPVYNSEPYLKKSIDSVINQTYSNLEIIIVNDGSTDGSGDILDKYAENDNRIKLIHKENGGIGSAYDVAFSQMTGNYVSFIDSDDYVTQNYYEEIINEINRHKPDIVHFGRVLFSDENKITDNLKRYNEVIEGNDKILHHHFTKLKDPSLACRVFDSKLFTDIKLFDQNIGIDEIIIVQVLKNTKKVVFTDKVYYYTYERSDSVSRIEYSNEKIRQGMRIYQFICEFSRKNISQYSKHLELKYLTYLLPLYESIYLNNKKNQLEKTIKSDIIKYHKLSHKYNEYKYLPFLMRIKIRSILLNGGFFALLIKSIHFKKRIF